MAELQKHPYNYSKFFLLILVEKTWHWNILDKGVCEVAQTTKIVRKRKLAMPLWVPSGAINDDKNAEGHKK
jgi:hypothetical protein